MMVMVMAMVALGMAAFACLHLPTSSLFTQCPQNRSRNRLRAASPVGQNHHAMGRLCRNEKPRLGLIAPGNAQRN
jgi:hypothetical protein